MEPDVQRRLGELEATVFGVNGSNGMRLKVKELELEMTTIKTDREKKERFKQGLLATVAGAALVALMFQMFAAFKSMAMQETVESAVKKLDAVTQEIKAKE